MVEKHKFYPEEVERLRSAWIEMRQRRSDGTGSAWGEHYILRQILRECGVHVEFESSSQIENYIEYVITYAEAPDVY